MSKYQKIKVVPMTENQKRLHEDHLVQNKKFFSGESDEYFTGEPEEYVENNILTLEQLDALPNVIDNYYICDDRKLSILNGGYKMNTATIIKVDQDGFLIRITTDSKLSVSKTFVYKDEDFDLVLFKI